MRSLPWLALLAIGCNGGGAATIKDAPTVAVSGTFRVFGFNAPAPDVLVCALKNDENCVRTDDQGSFTLEVPAEAEIALTLTHRDFTSFLLPLVTGSGDSDPFTVLLWANDTWSETLSNAGASWDPSTAAILLWARQGSEQPAPGAADPGAADVAVRTDPSVRAYYFDDSGVHLDGVLTRTTDAGMVAMFGLPKGEVAVELTPDTGICAPRELAWSGGALPTIANHVTLAIYACTPAR